MQLKADLVSFRCDYCHSVYFPDQAENGVRVLGGDATGLSCPICNIPVVNSAIGAARMIYCARCHGMMAPMPAIEGLIDAARIVGAAGAAPAASDPADLHRKLACPRCHHAMDAHFYAGPGNVIVNSCEDCCLLWLDRGGLMRIAHFSAADASSSDASSSDASSADASSADATISADAFSPDASSADAAFGEPMPGDSGYADEVNA
jgi:Zn-finger nucleic acid-binding protein